MTDPIVEEVRAIRAKIAEECGYDLKNIIDHAREAVTRIPGLKYVTRDELASRRNAASAKPDQAHPSQPK